MSDSELLTCLAEIARVVTENGHLIVEESMDETSYPFLRMLSAMEITGFQQDPGELAQRLTGCASSSSSSAYVFRKVSESKGCT
jgi:ubiquinone/menaquinone biosynthesis C-methylase UbiE